MVVPLGVHQLWMAAANIDGITNYSADSRTHRDRCRKRTKRERGSLRFAFVIRFGAVAAAIGDRVDRESRWRILSSLTWNWRRRNILSRHWVGFTRLLEFKRGFAKIYVFHTILDGRRRWRHHSFTRGACEVFSHFPWLRAASSKCLSTRLESDIQYSLFLPSFPRLLTSQQRLLSGLFSLQSGPGDRGTRYPGKSFYGQHSVREREGNHLTSTYWARN